MISVKMQVTYAEHDEKDIFLDLKTFQCDVIVAVANDLVLLDNETGKSLHIFKKDIEEVEILQ